MKVFISYYRKTGWFAASIFEQWLRDAGIQVIMDQKNFQAGKLPEEIERHIEGCDVLLVVLSYNYYRSDWTKQEINLASRYKKHIYYVATAKDLRAKNPPTFESYSDDLPLELWGKEVSKWGEKLLDLLKGLIKTGQVKDHDERFKVRFNAWFSKNIKCNDQIKEVVAQENIVNSLHVSSCVELAHSLHGWTKNDIFSHDGGTFTPEPEVLAYLRGQRIHNQYPPVDVGEKPDNWALASLSDWLSDTKYLELYFQAISHDLVRQVADNFEALYYHQDKVKRPRLFDPGHLAFPHSVIVHMVLVTKDDYLIIGQRTANVRFYENHWATTYEEHMRISNDYCDPFAAVIRGLKEELVAEEDKTSVTREIRFFSVFRELDHWENISKRQAFWVANVGLAGRIRLNLSADDILAYWSYHKEKGSGLHMQDPEFQHLVAIPYSFENLLRLVTEDTFNPATFAGLRVPTGVDREFPEIAANPRLQCQHPTNKIRLIRCLTSDDKNFRWALQTKIRTESGL